MCRTRNDPQRADIFVKCISQKRSWSNNKKQPLNILVTFIFISISNIFYTKPLNSVISVIQKLLPSELRAEYSSVVIGVRLVHFWAGCIRGIAKL